MAKSEEIKHGHPEIVICTKCKGSGKQKVTDQYEQFKRPHGREPCTLCEGSGRLVIRVETRTLIEPFEYFK